MLEFKTPQIEDKAWVDQCFKHLKTMKCDYTFGNMFVWNTEYSTKICRFKDFFICSWGMGKETNFGIPVGKGDFKEAVEEVIKYAKSNDIMPRFYGVTEAYVEMLNENFPDAFQFLYDESYGDYIYEVEKMASLKGKKYHGKRNHITNFKKNNPNWSFETINKDNIDDCINLHAKWINTHVDDSDISFNLIYSIIERLHALQESHNISCACGSEDIELNIINGNIILTCLQCKKSKAIETTEETLTRLLNAKAIIIGK